MSNLSRDWGLGEWDSRWIFMTEHAGPDFGSVWRGGLGRGTQLPFVDVGRCAVDESRSGAIEFSVGTPTLES
jgi:hypothetical protein